MSQPLTPFWPIFAGKSDGQDVVNQKGVVLRNGPTQEQLDRTPNEQGQSDYYRLIERDEPKHMDWRKKLGGMLLREIGGKAHEDKWTQCILWDFPDGYRLFEHIKSKVNGETKAVKNHSGGGHDRQDAYLYGYPKGPRKRFRSPIEFFPHLLWLCTDENSDYQNCACRICSPMQLDLDKDKDKDKDKPVVKPELKPAAATPPVPVPVRRPSMPPTTANTTNANNNNMAANNIAASNNNNTTSATQSPRTRPTTPAAAPHAPLATQIRPPPRLEASPLPQPRSLDQQVDSQYGKFIARTGEVVWFFRPSTAAWGLGLVVRRWAPRSKPTDRCYSIQPLSHPYNQAPQELVSTDQNLKPWLAWSAPSCTYAYLQQNPRLAYHEVDWHTLLSGHWGDGVAEVDASILAAKAIDTTYTLFGLMKTIPQGGVEERYYNGIYLGAEKIWNGEPVRLRMAMGTDILVITSIVEKVFTGPPNQPNVGASRIEFRGDVYSYDTLPAPNPNALPQAPSSNNIPMRMREDMRWRNQTLVPATQSLAYWKLMRANATIDMEEVKGRWYETSLLFVDFFTKAIKNNEGGNGVWMNARGDATGVGKAAGTQEPNRVAAFGAAIPKTTQIIEGLDAPDEHNESSASLPTEQLGMGSVSHQGAFALDDFMNFDEGTEGGDLAFSQNFQF